MKLLRIGLAGFHRVKEKDEEQGTFPISNFAVGSSSDRGFVRLFGRFSLDFC